MSLVFALCHKKTWIALTDLYGKSIIFDPEDKARSWCLLFGMVIMSSSLIAIAFLA
jgi:hypothetical protein